MSIGIEVANYCFSERNFVNEVGSPFSILPDVIKFFQIYE